MTDRRVPDPVVEPIVLTIAGSDSGGGAGIQADLKTIEATGGFGASAVTAVTAQNSRGVESTHVLPVGEVDSQIDAVRTDLEVEAVKTGMLATAEIVEAVAAAVAALDAAVVVDPVMVAATGDRLLSEAAESTYESLVAEATLVTPNADEAAVLSGIEPEDRESARRAGERLLEMGADAALLKGGHVPGETVRDVLVTPEAVETFSHSRVETDATHGSGCTLSAAIATRLARGESVPRAVEQGISFVQRAIRYHHLVGTGPGAVHHLAGIRNEAARWSTVKSLESAVDRLLASNLDPLVSAEGTNLVAATPHAAGIDDMATFDGGLDRTDDGLEPLGPVRFGDPTTTARRLLDAREFRPDLRAALECRLDDDLERSMETLGWTLLDHLANSSENEPMNRLAATERMEDDVIVLARDRTATVLGAAPDALVDELSELLETL